SEAMGETAENVAERYEVAREDQDEFALASHQRAVAASEAGRFDDEIVPVPVPQPKGDPLTVHTDEGPRPDTTLERLAGLKPAGMSIDEIELVELNEAFASQSIACMRELGIDRERLNVNGGAIALGHPLGCSGARLLTTLLWEMRRRGARFGLATMCIGVG